MSGPYFINSTSMSPGQSDYLFFIFLTALDITSLLILNILHMFTMCGWSYPLILGSIFEFGGFIIIFPCTYSGLLDPCSINLFYCIGTAALIFRFVMTVYPGNTCYHLFLPSHFLSKNLQIERHGRVVSTPVSYSGSPGLECRLGDWLL
jgi:hypothetical protein